MKTKLVNKDIRHNYTNELLLERGLSPEELNYFLKVPNDSALQTPCDLDWIDRGRELLDEMILLTNEDRIIVIVDSDVDGFTSAAIFIQYLRKFNKEVQIDYILHKGKGHGLSDTIEEILEKQNENPNIKFVVLPDSSSNDFEYHEQLGKENISCLVLDHHIVEPDTHFSDYAVIINNQLSQFYLNKDLCGAGVTWQLCRYFDKIKKTSYADEFIDLAALGIVSDMMSMLSLENRYIVHTGLSNIKNYYFKALCEKQAF